MFLKSQISISASPTKVPYQPCCIVLLGKAFISGRLQKHKHFFSLLYFKGLIFFPSFCQKVYKEKHIFPTLASRRDQYDITKQFIDGFIFASFQSDLVGCIRIHGIRISTSELMCIIFNLLLYLWSLIFWGVTWIIIKMTNSHSCKRSFNNTLSKKLKINSYNHCLTPSFYDYS